MRERLEFNLTNSVHFRVEETAHQYHENGILHGVPDISNREHFGYNRDSVMHLHRDACDLRNIDDTQLMEDIPDDIVDQIGNLYIVNQAAGSSKSKSNKTLVTTNNVTQSHVSHQDNTLDKSAGGTSAEPGFFEKTKRGFNTLFGVKTTTETVVGKKPITNHSSKPEKVTLVIEMARMPALMVEIDKSKTIAQLKVSDIIE